MASTLALLRPSAPGPLAGASARSPAAAAVRVPLRSRFSTRVSLGSAVAAGADTLFADYKPTTAFLFPGQVRI
jgi:[acyl-carrier-protein] S-malonyltransferase